jgi:MFS family permease
VALTGAPTNSRPHATRTLAILLLGTFTFAISQTMMNPAFPLIAARFHATEATVAWTLSGFFLTASISPGVSGRLGDMFGKRRVLIIALLLFAGGGAVCALAQSVEVLIAGRLVMGSGAGIFPLSFSIVRDELSPARMTTAIGVLSAMVGLGAALGFPIGGLLLDGPGLPSIFWTMTGLAAVAAAAVYLGVPESPVRTPGRIDWAGSTLFAIGLAAVLGSVSGAGVWGWLGWPTLVLFFSGLALLVAFVAVEKRTTHPLVHLPTFVDRAVLPTNLATLLLGTGVVVAFIAVPQLAQLPASSRIGFGDSASRSGLYLIPMSAFIAVSAPFGGRLTSRLGARNLLQIGALLSAAGLFGLAALHGDRIDLYLWPTIFGIGTGLSYAAMPVLIVRAVAQEQTGEATGLNTLLRNAGGGLGSQMSTSLIGATVSPATGLASDTGFTLAFVAGGLACLAGLVVASWIPNFGRGSIAVERRLPPTGQPDTEEEPA